MGPSVATAKVSFTTRQSIVQPRMEGSGPSLLYLTSLAITVERTKSTERSLHLCMFVELSLRYTGWSKHIIEY